MNKTRWAMVIAGGIMAVIYLAILTPSSQGYGYAGHRSGFYYFSGGNSTVFGGRPSARRASRSGPRVSGRGLSGGK